MWQYLGNKCTFGTRQPSAEHRHSSGNSRCSASWKGTIRLQILCGTSWRSTWRADRWTGRAAASSCCRQLESNKFITQADFSTVRQTKTRTFTQFSPKGTFYWQVSSAFICKEKQFNSWAPAVPLLLALFLAGRPVSVTPVAPVKDTLHSSYCPVHPNSPYCVPRSAGGGEQGWENRD